MNWISDLPQSLSITAAQLLHVNLPQCSPLKKGGDCCYGGQLTARLPRHRCPAAYFAITDGRQPNGAYWNDRD